ncbi:SAM-dependent methyltransferase [Streptomyces sp. NPDC093707]|uniref:SAM-dependent methyltransferase n=1 Tax=Streptomyces sp. NPDC093707 TaxID=3154984 RepID=UPI00344F3DB2
MRPALPLSSALVPAEPRVYDYLLGGKHNYQLDRVLGDRLVSTADWLPRAAQLNRAFGSIAVAHLARSGIHQFLDLGCGYPVPKFLAVLNPHEAAVRIRPDARFVHVDHDPVVAAHAVAFLSGPHDKHGVVCGDIRELGDVLADAAARKLDRDQRTGVLLHDVLPWIPDDAEAHQLLADLRDVLPAGSAISITHATADMRPADVRDLAALYEQHGLAFRPRSYTEVRALLDPWPLAEPGVVPTSRWQAGPLHPQLPDAQSNAYAAVALHPDQPRGNHA